jgi:serine/threonine-protein kinase
MALTAGTKLAHYDIIEPLGKGGMGEVYRAKDQKLGRDVAIKMLPEEFAQDSDRVARLEREAKLLASLNHPNIAAIHGLEEANGTHFLVLELVEGDTLADRLTHGPIPVEESLKLVLQIAEALQAAHERGVIHRDLKPANIKITHDGTVKVLDFGLAKARDVESSGAKGLSNSPTMRTAGSTLGMILGTAAYMSPEQAKGNPVDRRTDIFAFGCVLYEMLTGKRAFEGEDVSDTLAAVLRAEPDWTALPADLPPVIRTLVQRCLEKDRRQRIADISTAGFLIKERRQMPATLLHPNATRWPVWKSAVPVLIAAIAALAIIAIAVWSFRPSTPLTMTRFSFTLGEDQQFTNTGRHAVAISPDGTEIVYVANQQLYLRSMSEIEARPISGIQLAPGVTTPVFSPDGRSVAFVSVGTLKRMPLTGGAPVTISELGGGIFGMSWEGDTILLGLGNRGIMRVSANGGTPEPMIAVKDDEVAHGPQMLPGGRAVLFTLATGTADDRWERAKIVVQTLGSGERKILIDAGADARYLPTGHLVYARGGVLFAVPFDPGRVEIAGTSVPIVEGVRRSVVASNTGAAHFSVSNTGSLIYIPGPASTALDPRDLALRDRKGMVQTLKLPARPYESPRFSPDGRRVAVGTDDDKEAVVWIHELAGTSSPRRLTLGGRNRFPIWTADGERVAFQSDREGDLGIFWQRADGTGTPERLTRPQQGESHVPLSWSPDGERFLFSVSKGANFSLWTFSLMDRKAAPFGAVESSLLPNAVFSPDGRWVAYESRTGFSRGVFLQPFPSTGERYQISSGGFPIWSSDGKEIFFAEPASTGLTVVSITTRPSPTFGNPTHVPRAGFFAARSENLRNFDIAPDDNRQIGVVDAGETQPQIRVVLNWFEELRQRVRTK